MVVAVGVVVVFRGACRVLSRRSPPPPLSLRLSKGPFYKFDSGRLEGRKEGRKEGRRRRRNPFNIPQFRLETREERTRIDGRTDGRTTSFFAQFPPHAPSSQLPLLSPTPFLRLFSVFALRDRRNGFVRALLRQSRRSHREPAAGRPETGCFTASAPKSATASKGFRLPRRAFRPFVLPSVRCARPIFFSRGGVNLSSCFPPCPSASVRPSVRLFKCPTRRFIAARVEADTPRARGRPSAARARRWPNLVAS